MNHSFKENLITTKDASELSGYTSDYLARLVRSGEIQGKRVGHSWVISSTSLETFMTKQKGRKLDRARELASSRVREYNRHNQFVRRTTRALTEKISIPKFSLEEASPRAHSLALGVAVAVVALGAVGANAAALPYIAQRASALATEISSGFVDTFGTVPTRIAMRVEESSVAVQAGAMRNRIASRRAEYVAVPGFASIDLEALRPALTKEYRAPRAASDVARSPSRTGAPILTAADVHASAATVYAFLANPSSIGAVLADAYFAIGTDAYAAVGASFSAYRALIDDSGAAMLALAATTRDTLARAPHAVARVNVALGEAVVSATHAAIRADVIVAHGLAAAAPESARIAVMLMGTAGDRIARVTEQAPARIAGAYLNATAVPAVLAPRLAEAVFGAEYAVASRFVSATSVVSERYLALVEGTGNLAYEGSANARSVAQSVSRAVAFAPAAIEDATLGALGKSAVALDSVTHLSSFAAVLPALSASEKTALAVYEAIYAVFDSANKALLAFFTTTPETVLPTGIPKPRVITIATSTRPVASGTQPITAVSYPTYTTVVRGVSEDFMNQSLASLRTNVLATVAGMIQPVSNQVVQNITTVQQLNRIDSLHDLVVQNGDFRNSIFDSGIRVNARDSYFDNLTAGTTTLATTTVNGTLTISSLTLTGSLSSPGVITGSHFVSTSTNATSTFAGSINVDNAGLVYATSTRNVGIGVLSPAALLAVQNSTSTQPIFVASNAAGAEVYRLTNDGFVGIGTTSPTYNLAVEGSSSLGNNAIAGYFTATTSIATSTFAGGLAVGTSKLVVDSTTGNIGVGTTSPSSLVDAVSGVSLFRFSSGASNVTPSMVVANTSTNGKAAALVAGTNGAAFNFDSAGFFVIGAEPHSAFVGNSLGTAAYQMRVNAAGQVGIGDSYVPTALLDISTSSPSGYTNALKIAAKNSDALGTGLGLVFFSSVADSIATYNSGRIVSAFDTANYTGGRMTFQTPTGAGTFTDVLSLKNGGVGIGTTSPSGTLAVAGDFFLTGSTTITGADSGIVFTGSGNHDITASGGTLRIGTNTIIGNIEALNDTVDIGTAVTRFDKIYANEVNASTIVGTLTGGNLTAETFTINSDNATADTENAYLVFERGTVIPNASLAWNAAEDAKRFEFNQPLFIQNASASTTLTTFDLKSVAGQTADIFRVASSSADTLFNVTSSGNVGIGTTDPGSFKLDVNGNVRAYGSGNSFTAGDGTNAGAIIGTHGGGNSNTAWRLDTTSGHGVIRLIDASEVTQVRFGSDGGDNYIKSGNVGIGTTTPTTKLYVAGGPVSIQNTGVGGSAAIWLNFNNSNSATKWFVNEYSSGDLNFAESGIADGRLYLKAGGNVGIGTTNPGSKLEVVSSVTGAEPAIITARTSTASNSYLTQLGMDSSGYGYLQAQQVTVTYNVPLAIQPNGGNVGIGTTSPQSKLHVRGLDTVTSIGGIDTLRLTGGDAVNDLVKIGFSNSDDGSLGFIGALTEATGVYPNSKGSLLFGTQNLGSSNEWMRITSAGNVGIGTTTPWGQLSVNPNGITGPAFVVGSSTATNFVVTNGGYVGVGTANPAAQMHINVDNTTNTGLLVGTNANVASAMSFNSRAFFGYGGNDLTVVQAIAGKGIQFNVNNSTFGSGEAMRITSAGNVGIGTTSPAAKLDVAMNGAGDSIINISALSGNAAAVRFQKAGASYWEAGRGVTDGLNDYQIYDFQGTPGARLTVQSGTGNVGIGTTSPSNLLHVQKDQSAATRVQITNENTGTGSQAGLYVTNSATANYYFTAGLMGTGFTTNGLFEQNKGVIAVGSQTDGLNIFTQKATAPIIFGTGGSAAANERMRITETGAVGIGTTSPAQKLVVSGNVLTDNANSNLSAYNIINRPLNTTYDAATWYQTASVSKWIAGLLSASSGGSASADNYSIAYNNGSWNNAVTINTSGYVGIGTTNPQRLLELSNASGVFLRGDRTSGSGDVLTIVGTGQAAVEGARIVINMENTTDAASNVQFYTHNGAALGERMRIDNSGNVGIGTTSPYSKLTVQVAGDTSIGAAVDDGINITVGDTAGQISTLNFSNTSAYSSLGGIAVENDVAGAYPTAKGIMTLYTQNGATRTDALTILSNGNVGIGTTGPNARLDIQGGNVGIGIVNSAENLAPLTVKDTYGVASGAAPQGGIVISNVASVNTVLDLGIDNGYSWIQSRNYGSAVYLPLALNPISGNVGIGTTTPGAKLDVYGDPTSAQLARIDGASASTVLGNDYAYLSLHNTNTTNSNYSSLYFDTNDTTGAYKSGAAIQGIYTSHGSVSGELAFSTNNAGTLGERMRITAAGNVGIGTTGPVANLDVTGVNPLFSMYASNGFSDLRRFTFQNVTGSSLNRLDLRVENDTGSLVRTPVTIQSDGNVGIGTTTPTSLLTVGAGGDTSSISSTITTALFSNAGATNLAIRDSTNNVELLNYAYTGGGIIGTFTNNNLTIRTNNLDRMTFDTSGNVGIGTTTPEQKLDVLGNIRAFQANGYVQVGNNTGNYILQQSDNPFSSFSNAGGAVLYPTGTTKGAFVIAPAGTSDTTKWTTFATSGNVGIGTTNPTGAKLNIHVATDNNFEVMTPNSGTGSRIMARNDSGTLNRLELQGETVIFPLTTGADGFVFNASNGNVGIGTTSPAYKLDNWGTFRTHAGTNVNVDVLGALTAGSGASIRSFNDAGDTYLPMEFNASLYTFMTGNVGIGTTTPALYSGSSNRILSISGSSNPGLLLENSSVGGRQFFIYSDTSNPGSLRIYDPIAAAVRFVLDSSGNVGIGTTDPSQKLEVYGNVELSDSTITAGVRAISPTGWGYSPNAYRVAMIGASSGNESVSIGYDPSGNANGSFTGDGREVLFRRGVQFVTPNAANDAFNLTNLVLLDGNVGIGTTTPQSNLSVANGSAGNQDILDLSWKPTANGDVGGLTFHREAGLIGRIGAVIEPGTNGMVFYTGDNNSISERMRINGSGNVGIGTTSPTGLLSLSGGTAASVANPIIDLINDRIINWRGSSGGVGDAGFLWYDSSNNLKLGTNNDTKVTISSSGDVGIGTTNPGAKLDVSGTFTVSDTATFNKAGLTTLPANAFSSGSNVIAAMFGSGSTAGFTADQYGGAIRFNGTGVAWGDMSFYPNGGGNGNQGNFRFSTTGSILSTTPSGKLGVGELYSVGNVGIGTTSPFSKLSVTGSGTVTGQAFAIADSNNVQRFVVQDNGDVTVGVHNATTNSGSTAKIRVANYYALGGLYIGNGAFPGHMAITSNTYGRQGNNDYAPLDVTDYGAWNILMSNYAYSPGGYSIQYAAPTVGTPSFSTYFNISAAGLTGIGTTTQASKLAVSGGASIGANYNIAAPTNGLLVEGNVGIGTTNPGAKLDVRPTRTSGTNADAIYLSDAVTGAQTAGYGTRIIGSSNAGAAISGIGFETGGDGTNNQTQLSFYTQASAGTPSFTPGNARMVIDASGNVGIGTTAPEGKLHVHTDTAGAVTVDTGADDLIVENSGVAGISILSPDASVSQIYFGSPSDSVGALLRYDYTANNLKVGNSRSGGTLSLVTGAESAGLTIDTSGNVGIGTTTPGVLLDVYGNAMVGTFVGANNGSIDIKSGATGLARLIFNPGLQNNRGFIDYDATNKDMLFKVNETNAMVIKNGGNVGIGTTSPIFDANSGSGATYLTVQSASTLSEIGVSLNQTSTTGYLGGYAFVNAGLATTEKRNAVILGANDGATNSGNIQFWTSSAGTLAERMRIDKSGNVGIGTTSPSAKFSVGGVAGDTTGHGYFSGGLGVGVVNTTAGSLQVNGTGTFANLTTTGSDSALLLSNGGASTIKQSGGGYLVISTTGNNIYMDPAGSLYIRPAGGHTAMTVSSGVSVVNYLDVAGANTSAGPVVSAVGSDTNIPINITGKGTGNIILNGATAGNVGIGTTNPVAKLQINTTSQPGNATWYNPSTAMMVGTSTNGGSTLANPETILTLSRNGISGQAYDNFARFDLKRYINTSVESKTQMDIRLSDADLNTEGNNTPVIISFQSGGNVGIGTTTPDNKLTISGAYAVNQDYGLVVNDGQIASTFYGVGLKLKSDSGGNYRGAIDNMVPGTTYEAMSFNSGNVGIGTTGPTSPLSITDGVAPFAAYTGVMLDIKRNVSNGDDTTSRSGLRLSNNSNGFEILYGGTTDRLRFLDGGDVEVMSLKNGGNVGIGTTTPEYKLVINGSTQILAGENLNFQNVAGSGNSVIANTGAGTNKELRFDTGVTGALFIQNGGNVGIGTTDPGSFNAQLASYSAGGAGTYLGHANSGGTFPKVSALSLGSDAVSFTHTSNGGTYALSGSAQIAAIQSASINAPTDLAFYTTAGGAVGEHVRITSAGNVGIGTTTPNAKLQVYGSSVDISTSVPLPANESIFRVVSSNTAALDFGSQVSSPFGMWLQSRDYAGGTTNYPLLLNPNGGNVGIGTTSPLSILTIGNGAGFSNTLLSLDARVASDVGVDFYKAGVGKATIYVPASSNDLRIRDSSTDMITFQAGGNVGIGTTAPGVKLDVYNPTADTENIRLSQTGTSQGIAWYSNISGAPSSEKNWAVLANTLTYGDFSFRQSNAQGGNPITAGTDRLYISNTGNTGIGTTTPAYKLSVEGSSTLGNQAIAGYFTATSTGFRAPDGTAVSPSYSFTASSGTGIYSPSTNNLSFTTNTNERMTINSSGYVAIGGAVVAGQHLKVYGDATVNNLTVSVGSIRVPDGTVGSPGIAFSSQTNVGFFRPTTNVIGLAINGTESIRFNSLASVGSFQPSQGSDTSTGYSINSRKSRGTVTSPTVINAGDDLLNINGYGYVGATNTYVQAAGITFDSTGTISDSSTGIGGIIRFNTRNTSGSVTERMTILNSGNVGIGTTSPATLFEVGGSTANVTFDGYLNCTGFTSNANGLLACTASDERLKQNVVALDGASALAGLNALNPVSFYWNPATERGSAQQYGLIAQQVQMVFPNLVATSSPTALTPDGTLSVNYEGLISPMVMAIQELDARTTFISNAATSTVLTVDVAGNVGIGTTTPNHTLSVAGDIGAIAFVNTSTRSAKTDIDYATASSSADRLNQLVNLKVATYRYTIEDQNDPLRLGLIAEDTQAIAPEILSADGKGVDIYELATFTLSGVQALAAKVDAQETRMASLEDRINALESGAISSASGSPLALSSSTLASALEGFGVLIRNGIAQFNTLVFRQLVASRDADGTSSAGSVTIIGGNTIAQVTNSLVQPSTKVFVTFNSSVTGSWWVSDKTNGSFRVVLSEPQSSDVSFDYFLVQTEGQIATSTPVTANSTQSTGTTSGTDTTAPVITLLGDNPLHLSVGGTFVEPGVTVTDNADASVPYVTFVNGIEMEATAGSIDTSVQTTYIITYSATDARGNLTTATRSVIIGSATAPSDTGSTPPTSADTIAPVVSLTGGAALELTVGDTFTDPGATATDDIDGNVTSSIAVSGTVDTATEGLYTLTYTATDAAGNSGSVSRVVTVVAAPAPAPEPAI